MLGRRLVLALLVLAVGVVPALAPTPASAGPVMCAEGDVTVDGRIFPEPEASTSYLRFAEFECGIEFLAERFPGLVEITEVGRSEEDHAVYDVLVTDEAVTTPKEKLLVVSSIHGNEIGAREGGARVMEDMVDPRFLADEEWMTQLLDQYVVHFLFPNPDGWVAGELTGSDDAGVAWTRGNGTGRDLNRNFPVQGFISGRNGTLEEPESQAIVDEVFGDDPDGWYLGTDNHGQGGDTYAAAGLQIVGEFDYQKSETLARFADGIDDTMAEYDVLENLQQLNEASGQDAGSYHWGTLYDMLGYSASGSLIDYYNTVNGVGGSGFATELTAGQGANFATYVPLQNQIFVDSIRAINYTMFRQAVDRQDFTYEVGGEVAYLFDPEVVTSDDTNGVGHVPDPEIGEVHGQQPYSATRMRFFEDLNGQADRPLTSVRVGEVASGAVDLAWFDSLVLANDALPEPGGIDSEAWFARLREWVEAGGNLVVTDAAAPALASLGLVPAEAVTMEPEYVGFADFTDRSLPLNENLRGVASQTYDTVPIGYSFGTAGGAPGNTAPNWKVSQSAWEAAGGITAGTNGTGQTIYGEAPLGEGRVRFLGALLPDPTEEYYHPFGLQSYAVTYTGYTLLQNMLRWDNPTRVERPVEPGGPGSGPGGGPGSGSGPGSGPGGEPGAGPGAGPGGEPQPGTDPEPGGRPAESIAVRRLAGADRVETAARISEGTREASEVVVLARADEYADALAGGPLAASLGAPLLLTPSDRLADVTAAEVARLGATEAVLLGGEAALSAAVASDLSSRGVLVRRVAGTERFATAAAIAGELGASDEVLVAEGANADPARGWPDALSASALGSAARVPVLLVERDRLPEATATALDASDSVTVVGGPAAVGDPVVAALDERAGAVARLAGPNRYATSRAVADEAVRRGVAGRQAFIATGRAFADGLTAGAATGAEGGALLLADDGASEDALSWLEANRDALLEVTLAGGTAAVGGGVEEQIRTSMR